MPLRLTNSGNVFMSLHRIFRLFSKIRGLSRPMFAPMALVLVFVLSFALNASAQSVKDVQKEFNQAYKAASKAFNKGDFAKALPQWQKAYDSMELLKQSSKVAKIKEKVELGLAMTYAGLALKDPDDTENFTNALKWYDELLNRKKLYGTNRAVLYDNKSFLLSRRASQICAAGKCKEALPLQQQAIKVLQKMEPGPTLDKYLAYERSSLARTAKYASQYKIALEAADLAVAYWRKSKNNLELARESILRDSILLDLGRISEAKADLEKLLPELIKAASDAAAVPEPDAKTAGTKEAKAAAKAQAKRITLIIDAGVNAAVCASVLGRYGEAAALLKQAAEWSAKAKNNYGTEAVAIDRGILNYHQGLYFDALAAFEKVSGSNNAQRRAKSLSNAGCIYLSLYRDKADERYFEKSKDRLLKALPLGEESGDLGTAVAAATNLGLLYLYKSRNEAVADPASELLVQAVEILLKGEAQARKLAADQAQTPEYAEAEIDLGDVFLELYTRFRGGKVADLVCPGSTDTGYLDCAQQYYESGLQIASSMKLLNKLWRAYHGLARVHQARGDTAAALENYRKAVDVVENLRNLLSGSQSVGFLHDKHIVYTDCVEFLLEQWKKSADGAQKTEYARQSLIFLERSRLNGLKSVFERALPPEKQAVGGELAEVNYQLAVLRLAPDVAPHSLAPLEKRKAELEKALEQDDPYLQKPAPALDICQKRIAPDQVVLEFYYTKDNFYIWKIRADSLELFTTPRLVVDEATDEEFDFLSLVVDDFLEHIVLLTAQRDERTASKITDDLARMYERFFVQSGLSLPEAGGRLTIVPYKKISVLPFAAMAPDSNAAGENLPLVAQYTINYLTSLNQLLLEKKPGQAGFYGVGNPQMPRPLAPPAQGTRGAGDAGDPGDTDPELRLLLGTLFGQSDADGESQTRAQRFAALPDAGQEVRSISQLYEQQQSKNLSITVDQPVTLRELFAGLEQGEYDTIHLATHGKLVPGAPLLSFLAFSEDDQEQDQILQRGLLTVKSIREKLFGKLSNTRLCVLSCCETARIGEMNGLEYASLAGAFQSAGIKRIIASLWEVPSKETSLLMERFYGKLFEQQGDPDYALALRQAQDSVRAEQPDPYYWAAFILIGS